MLKKTDEMVPRGVPYCANNTCLFQYKLPKPKTITGTDSQDSWHLDNLYLESKVLTVQDYNVVFRVSDNQSLIVIFLGATFAQATLFLFSLWQFVTWGVIIVTVYHVGVLIVGTEGSKIDEHSDKVK